jgi:hypothetical protein
MPTFTGAPCARNTAGAATTPVAAAMVPSADVCRNCRRFNRSFDI